MVDFKNKGTIFSVQPHCVVNHSLCDEVWAKVWPLSKNTKQDVGQTLDSVEVVCLCEKGRSEVISSYNDCTYSSG